MFYAAFIKATLKEVYGDRSLLHVPAINHIMQEEPKRKKKKTSLDLDLESMLDGFLVYQPNTGAASWVALTKMLLTVAEENESSTNSKGNGSAASYLSLWMRFLQREKNIEVSLL